MRDPYKSLAVPRSASTDEIKRAFRILAKKFHPDTNNNDSKAALRLAEVMAAHAILGDEAKRRAFDRGEIDVEGKPAAKAVANALSGLTFSVAGLMVALAMLASSLLVGSLLPQRGPDDGDRVSSRVGANEESATDEAPYVGSGSRLLFPQTISYVAPDTIPLGIKVSNQVLGLTVEIRGLPRGTTLSAGRPLPGGGWRILATDVGNATIHLPPGFSGVLDLAIELRRIDDAVLDRRSLHLEWGPKPSITPEPIASASTVAASQTSANEASAIAVRADQSKLATNSPTDREPIELLIGRSEKLLSNGEAEAARILLRPAAEAHDARAALALGATYDPIILAILQARGVPANVPLALDWYEKAQGSGSREARQRLKLLTNALMKPKKHTVRPPTYRQRAPYEGHGIDVAGADAYPDPLTSPPAFIQ